jgi:hypothetical protein
MPSPRTLFLAGVFGLVGDAAVAQQLLDVVSVPVNGATSTSNIVLAVGVTYTLEASGTFSIGGPGDGLGDAEYADFSNPPISLLDTCGGGSPDLGISVDGNPPNWQVWLGTHVYIQSYVGTGNTLVFRYWDCNYGDNSGGLIVRIYESGCSVPLHTTLATTGGPPTIGSAAFALQMSGLSGDLGVLAYAFQASRGFQLFGCTLELAPAAIVATVGGIVPATGYLTFPLPIPNIPSLRGLFIAAQGARVEQVGSPTMTNLVTFVVT